MRTTEAKSADPLANLNATQRQLIADVQVLFPYLNMVERMDWTSRLNQWFGYDFDLTADILLGNLDAKT